MRKMLFGFEPMRALTDAECYSIWNSHWMPLPADGIPRSKQFGEALRGNKQ